MYKIMYYGISDNMTEKNIDEIIQDIEDQIILNLNLLNKNKSSDQFNQKSLTVSSLGVTAQY